MNKFVKVGIFSTGGLVLFVGSFIVFAALSGVPLHEVAIIGALIDPPAQEAAAAQQTRKVVEPAPERPKTDGEIMEASASVLGAFVLEAPFSTDELRVLQTELKSKLRDLDQRRHAMGEKERRLVEREEVLDLRYAELMTLRSALEEFEAELHARSDELQRDEKASGEREKRGWKVIARTFEDGEPAILVQRLMQYEPRDAARILRALEAEPARDLLNLLPPDSYREYADAFRNYGN